MSQADVELIRSGFDTFAQDGLDGILRLMARGRGSGVTLESKSAWLFTMRGGKAIRLALFHDTKTAIASVQDQSLRQ